MRTLNELSKTERLELYKKALVDWTERPNSVVHKTNGGLCKHFSEYGVDCCDYDGFGNRWELFEPTTDKCDEFVKHVNTHVMAHGFLGSEGNPIPRIAALKAMINQLEEELK